MNPQILNLGALSHVHALRALERLNELEADQRTKEVRFAELLIAPDTELMAVAEQVATKLLKFGVGIKVSVHWPFKGTASWALQTERNRLVNEVKK